MWSQTVAFAWPSLCPEEFVDRACLALVRSAHFFFGVHFEVLCGIAVPLRILRKGMFRVGTFAVLLWGVLEMSL